jgi:large subunit ribosomal protein L20
MARVKRGTMHVKRRNNILKSTKGYMWGRKSKIKLAKVAVLKAGKHAYRDRRRKKREMRALFQVRINAAVRPAGISYSRFMGEAKKANLALDRKILSTLAKDFPMVFEAVVKSVKA